MGPKEVALASAIKMGPGMKAPSLLYKLEPEYSEEARAAKFAGTVLLKIVVDVDGKAKDIDVVNGIGLGLDEQAVLAIRDGSSNRAKRTAHRFQSRRPSRSISS